jgi:hypothetical protein
MCGYVKKEGIFRKDMQHCIQNGRNTWVRCVALDTKILYLNRV